MPAKTYNKLKIEQGADFELNMVYKDANGAPVNLTGCEVRMQVRKGVKNAVAVLSLTSTPPAGITLGGVLGTIDIFVAAATTSTIPANDNYVYDLEVQTAGGLVRRLLQGTIPVSAEVTR